MVAVTNVLEMIISTVVHNSNKVSLVIEKLFLFLFNSSALTPHRQGRTEYRILTIANRDQDFQAYIPYTRQQNAFLVTRITKNRFASELATCVSLHQDLRI